MIPDQSYRNEADTLRRIVMEALGEYQRHNALHPDPKHWSNRVLDAFGIDAEAKI